MSSRIASALHFGYFDANRSVFGKDPVEQKFQHLRIAGFRQFDPFTHQLDFFSLKQGFGD